MFVNLFFPLQAEGSAIINFLPMIMIMIVIYFFFIRPQAKKQKAQGIFLGELQKGDEVVTASGVIGKINKIDGNIVHLQVDQKTFIRIMRSAISSEMTASLNKPEESK